VTERDNLLKRTLLLLSVLLVLALVLAGCGGGAASTVTKTGYHVGNLAPDFNLFSLDGKQVSLRNFLGKPVVVNFWATD
jgi:cytochrome oxidase Cu insertion factor (SCO1/SenC/PrrC family)